MLLVQGNWRWARKWEGEAGKWDAVCEGRDVSAGCFSTQVPVGGCDGRAGIFERHGRGTLVPHARQAGRGGWYRILLYNIIKYVSVVDASKETETA